MSDRSYTWVTVYACPSESLAAAGDAIVEAGITQDGPSVLAGGSGIDSAPVVLGVEYSDEEVPVGALGDLANKLLALGCTFECAQDARYEHAGEVYRGVPGLGLWFADHHEGDVYLCEYQLRSMIEAVRPGTDDLKLAILKAVGMEWTMALDAVRSAL